jgi:mannose-6-phosphate isomerase-like protein (cupin superfamily)
MSNFLITQLDQVPSQGCPCGSTRRAFVGEPGAVASMHLVDIHEDSRAHYHRRTTELYLVLEGIGEIELDGERYPVRPLTAVYIKPGCRHRAIGNLRIVNVPVPGFDEADEWFDEPSMGTKDSRMHSQG